MLYKKEFICKGTLCMWACVRAKSLSHFWLFVTLWTVARQVPLFTGFSRQEYWSGLPCPSPGDLPHPGIEHMSPVYPALQADFLPAEPSGQPKGTLYITGIKSWVKKDTSMAVNTRGIQWSRYGGLHPNPVSCSDSRVIDLGNTGTCTHPKFWISGTDDLPKKRDKPKSSLSANKSFQVNEENSSLRQVFRNSDMRSPSDKLPGKTIMIRANTNQNLKSKNL